MRRWICIFLHKLADKIDPRFKEFWYNEGYSDATGALRKTYGEQMQKMQVVIAKLRGLSPQARQQRRIQRLTKINRNLKRDLREIKKDFNDTCVYCGEKAETLDHIIPLSRGGYHIKENLVPCCLSCNRDKANKTLAEWKSKKKL